MTILYHGTTLQNAEEIKKSTVLYGPVFFTAKFDTASEYALNNDPNGVLLEIDYDGELMPDNESSEWKNSDEAIFNGGSVFTTLDISVLGAKFIYLGENQ